MLDRLIIENMCLHVLYTKSFTSLIHFVQNNFKAILNTTYYLMIYNAFWVVNLWGLQFLFLSVRYCLNIQCFDKLNNDSNFARSYISYHIGHLVFWMYRRVFLYLDRSSSFYVCMHTTIIRLSELACSLNTYKTYLCHLNVLEFFNICTALDRSIVYERLAYSNISVSRLHILTYKSSPSKNKDLNMYVSEW